MGEQFGGGKEIFGVVYLGGGMIGVVLFWGIDGERGWRGWRGW